MKYSSLQEYFYKLHNVLYGIILLPFLVFVVLYWQMQAGNIEGPLKESEEYGNLVLGIMGGMVLMDWLISAILFVRSLKATRTLESLGEKLDRYYVFTLFRFALVVSGSLALAIGFYLTENQTFTLVFVGNVAVLIFFWPTASKVCNDLKLKGDERTLVLYKKI